MKGRLLRGLRRDLVAGLVVAAPVGVTAWVLVRVFQFLDSILGRHLERLVGWSFPGVGLLALLLALLLVGWMLRWAVGRKLVGWWNTVLSRLPLTRTVYNATSQIAQAVLAREEKLFQGCALVEFPSPGSYTLAFVTARAPGEVEAKLGRRGVSVFLPTAPNPTTGYLLLLPEDRVHPLSMEVEDGMKLVLSAGTVVPGREGKPLAGLDLERLAAAVPGRRPSVSPGENPPEAGPSEAGRTSG